MGIHYFTLQTDKDTWNKFVDTIPRRVSIQRKLNDMLQKEIEAFEPPTKKVKGKAEVQQLTKKAMES